MKEVVWVTYLTKNYEDLIIGLIKSIKNYSNQKCLIFTINYDSEYLKTLGKQFITIRYDIDEEKNKSGKRDNIIMASKPLILSKSIELSDYNNFIYIDTDIYLTNVCDNLSDYFKVIENYPLLNSHVHDRLYANDINEDGGWVSTIDILSEATGIPVRIFPRRKANVILYNRECKWFFDEQMELYYRYKDKKRGIFRLHDEDSANILLSKYNYNKSLPMIDMEESFQINMDKINNYSFSRTQISSHVKLPSNINEFFCFHGFKDVNFYKKIESNYGNTVLKLKDFDITYRNQTLFFTKKGKLEGKTIKNIVDFQIFNEKNENIFTLKNQEINNYGTFYVSDLNINGLIKINIVETETNKIIYKNTIKI